MKDETIKQLAESVVDDATDRRLVVMAACLLAQPLLRDMLKASAKITDPTEHADFIESTYSSIATLCIAFARVVVDQYDATGFDE